MAEAALRHDNLPEIATLNAQAKDLFEKNQLNEALELSKLSIKLADSADANILYGRTLIKLGRRKEALAHLQTLQKKGLKHHLIDELMANIFLFTGDYDNAYIHFHNALKQNPKLKSARSHLARIYYSRQKFEEAEKQIQFAIDSGSKSSEVWGRYGRILKAQGKISEAYNAFLKEEELSKSFISSLNLASIELLQDDFNKYIKNKTNVYEKSFNYNFIRNKTSDTLFVLLSPHSSTFILQKYDFEGDCLFLNDGSESYYTYTADLIANTINDLQKTNNYKKIVLIGISKGATGSLIISSKLAHLLPSVKIKALAFSPQIFLWPFNHNLLMPSYLLLYERIAGNKLLEDNFVRYGNVDELLDKAPENLDATIIYGTGFNMDRVEAENTKTQKVKKIPLKYSSHGTLMVYTLPPDATKESLLQKSSTLQSNDDDSAALSVVSTQWIDELFEIHKQQSPSLKKLYEE